MDASMADKVKAAAKEYAAGLPVHIKKTFPNPDVEIVKVASSTAGMEILHACYVLAAEEGKSPQNAHDWFIASLKGLFEKVEASFQKIGINARFEVMSRSMDSESPEKWGEEEDWQKGRRW